MHLPPAPVWNASVDGIDMQDFTRRAQDFERTWLPRDVRLPVQGQVWRAIRESEVGFLAWFSHTTLGQHGLATAKPAPLFPFGLARLLRGEEVRILELDDPRPLTVSFVPVHYAELQDRLIPEDVRMRSDFSHYELRMITARTFGLQKQTDYFIECFELAEDQA